MARSDMSNADTAKIGFLEGRGLYRHRRGGRDVALGHLGFTVGEEE